MKTVPENNRYPTREAWLEAAARKLRPWILKAGGSEYPEPLLSVGLPSKGAFSAKRRRIGECWSEKCGDGRCAIFISPTLDKPLAVVDVLIHELIHASVGVEHQHKKPFALVAGGIGLIGKMNATYAGEELKSRLEELCAALGPLPHLPLKNFKNPSKAQKNRQRLYICAHCGQKIRAGTDLLEALHKCEDGEVALFVIDTPYEPEKGPDVEITTDNN